MSDRIILGLNALFLIFYLNYGSDWWDEQNAKDLMRQLDWYDDALCFPNEVSKHAYSNLLLENFRRYISQFAFVLTYQPYNNFSGSSYL